MPKRFYRHHRGRDPRDATAPTSNAESTRPNAIFSPSPPPLADNSPWEQAEWYRWRAEADHINGPAWMPDNLEIQRPSVDLKYQATIEPWKVAPIVGNHWVPVYYRTPPHNLVTDESAHTGMPHVSVTDGHYARFMPPPISSLRYFQHASRGQIPYAIPPVNDRGMPLGPQDYRMEQYSTFSPPPYND